MYSECCNILWKHVQRSHVTPEVGIELLLTFIATHVPSRALSRRALEISIQLRRPAYDALYLAAAESYRARVVTADTRLLNRVANTPFAPLVISLQDAAAN